MKTLGLGFTSCATPLCSVPSTCDVRQSEWFLELLLLSPDAVSSSQGRTGTCWRGLDWEEPLFGQPSLASLPARLHVGGDCRQAAALGQRCPAPACLRHGEAQGFGGQLWKKGSLWAEVEIGPHKAHLLFPPPPHPVQCVRGCAVPQVHLAFFLAQGKELLEAGGLPQPILGSFRHLISFGLCWKQPATSHDPEETSLSGLSPEEMEAMGGSVGF